MEPFAFAKKSGLSARPVPLPRPWLMVVPSLPTTHPAARKGVHGRRGYCNFSVWCCTRRERGAKRSVFESKSEAALYTHGCAFLGVADSPLFRVGFKIGDAPRSPHLRFLILFSLILHSTHYTTIGAFRIPSLFLLSSLHVGFPRRWFIARDIASASLSITFLARTTLSEVHSRI